MTCTKILTATAILAIAAVSLLSCGSTPKEPTIVHVKAIDYQFEVADSIPSGWVTFQFNNTGHAEHFFLLNRLPNTVAYE
ncbi:hypothetical protein GF377_01330, partial [candidate division GN15 bacterium]|nr:hypothetical protein [candidate division GN15 bacterium]